MRPSTLPYRSLRRNILAALSQIMAVIFLSVLILVAYAFYVTEKRTWSSRQQDALLVSESIIESFLEQINSSLKLAASVDADYIRQNPQFAADFLEQQPSLQEVVFINRQGNIYGSAFRDEPVLSNMFTISQSVWFSKAIQGEKYISRVYFSAKNNPYVIISVPSRYGMVAARLHLDVLREVMQRVRLGQSGSIYIIDEHGDLIADSGTTTIQQNLYFLDRPEMQSALESGAEGWQGAYTNFNGKQVLGQSMTVFDGKWLIFVEITREEAFATTYLVSTLIFFGSLFVFIAAMLLGNNVLVRYIFNPIEVLRNGVIQMGEGNLNHRIAFRGQDEITIVGEAFNEMAHKLVLRQTALDEALKKSMDVNRYKSQMLAHVSHDLRTPLSGITGFAEILADEVDGSLNEEQKENVERILANAKRLRDMVETLLDQAQLERGALKLSEKEFSTEKFVEPLLTAYAIMARSKEISLKVSFEPGFPSTLYGDMLRLQEILANLVDNAIKFTSKGGVTVQIFRPDAEHWAFEVTDSGEGIPAEAQTYIFEPFRQVDDSTTRSHGGAGLGLSIVKQLVQMMSGSISLRSKVGAGSTFTVILPFKKGSNHE